jgi:hypothetical protein
MKSIFYLLAGCCLMLLSCDKNKESSFGNIVYKLKFESTQSKSEMLNEKSVKVFLKSGTAGNQTDTLYTQFGDYITSLTPQSFQANLRFLFAQSQLSVANFVPGFDNARPPALFVDFSNSQEITASPQIMTYDISTDNEQYNWIASGQYAEDEITFTYFCFIPYYFYQEVELPAEYINVELNEFNMYYDISKYITADAISIYTAGGQYNCDSVKTENVLRIDYFPLIMQNEGNLVRFNFGTLDSGALRFISNDTTTEVNGSFTPITLTMPMEGETKELYSTVSFNTYNLIQLYAGIDNIPYTSDDIIVYAPEYWSRLSIKMEIK